MKYANAPWKISPAPVESTAFTLILGIRSYSLSIIVKLPLDSSVIITFVLKYFEKEVILCSIQ